MLLFVAASLAPHPALAVVACSLSSVNTLDFGSPSPLDAANTDVSQPFTVSCTITKNELPGATGSSRTLGLCASYDNGSGGASAGGNRQLTSGTSTALYDLYPTAAYGPTHWGNRSGAPAGTVAAGALTFTKPAGPTVPAGSTSLTTYARLFGGQVAAAATTQVSTLTLTVDAFWTDVKSDCGAGGTVAATTLSPQLARVTYQKECRVGTIPTLDFGAIGFLTANLDAATGVSVTCTSATTYKIGLGAGNGAGATTSARKMTRTVAPFSTVGYGLYRDAARTQNWGNETTAGSDTQNGTGTGGATPYSIYGRVPPQNTPEAGDYQDTIVLSVVF